MGYAKYKYIFTGDSITDSNRLWGDDPLGLGDGYVSLIDKMFKRDEIEREIVIKNVGYNGFMVEDLKEKWEKNVVEEEPKLITLLIGINDVGYCLGNDMTLEDIQFSRDYEGMLRLAEEKTDAEIVLVSPFVFSQVDEYAYWSPMVEEVNGLIEEIAERFHATYLNVGAKFRELTRQYGYQSFTTDGVHLTPYGNQVLAEEWYHMYQEKKKGEWKLKNI